MNKKRIIFFLVFVFLFGTFFVSAVSHNANEIAIKIDGIDRTLQYARDNGLLSGDHTYESPSQIPNPGHSAEEIWISTDNGEMDLLDALSQNISLKKDSFLEYSLTNAPIKFQLATEIISWGPDSGKNFQELIDEESLICVLDTCADHGWNCGIRNYFNRECGDVELSCGECSFPNICKSGVCQKLGPIT